MMDIPAAARTAAGFTLIELIAVLMITAILSIAIIPRMANHAAFDTRGFLDTTRASLQHARRVAIAQRRTICGTFAEGSLTFAQSSVNGAASCDQPMADPTGSGALVLSPPDGVSLEVSPATFTLDGLGRPSANVTVTIVGDVVRTLNIEAASGYVH